MRGIRWPHWHTLLLEEKMVCPQDVKKYLLSKPGRSKTWTAKHECEEFVRGVFPKGPDSSVGGVPVGHCPDEVHMEEEEVQFKVQIEEEEIGETHGREHGEEKERDDYADETKSEPTLEP